MYLRYRSKSVHRLATIAAATKAVLKARLRERAVPFTSRDSKATLLARLKAWS